jgi:MFS family permease
VDSLIFARIVYAINWLSIGPIFVLMSPDLGVGLSGLSTLTAAFYLGVGLMQIPGGIIAAKWGLKKTVTFGIFLSSLSVLATSVLSNAAEIAALRFVVGIGMALVFAPGVVLVAKLLGGEKSGMGIGLFSSAYNLGGVLGIFCWVVIALATTWRISIALSGGLGVLTGLLVLVFVPQDEGGASFSTQKEGLVKVLKDRQLIFLGLGTLGVGVGNIIISAFMVDYLGKTQGVSPALAGLVTSLVVVVPIFTSVWGGRVYDRARRPRLVMALALTGNSLALAIGAVESIYAAIASAALGGFALGFGYTFAFASAKDLNKSAEEYDTLAIAWVNAIALTGTFFPPLLYSYVVETAGYSLAWLASAAVGLAFLLPLLLMKEGFRR